MLSNVENEECLPLLQTMGISPGGRVAAEGCVSLPSLPTPGIGIRTSRGLESPSFVLL